MKNTRDEIIEDFLKLLSTASDEEYKKPIPMTEEEYKNLEKGIWSSSGETTWTPGFTGEPSGETTWAPGLPKTPAPQPQLRPEPKPEPEVEEEKPFKVKMPDGSVKSFRDVQEWREDARKRSQRPEEPTPTSEPEPKTESTESKDKEYSDEEVMQMIKEDPGHVATNLMLQRKPEYSKFIYPLLKSLVDWATETEVPVEKGGMLYEEMNWMLEVLEDAATFKEIQKLNRDLDEIEKLLDEEEAKGKPQSGEATWGE